jgi:protein-S-isoprenylcysteine O-methyltransferase Ste14
MSTAARAIWLAIVVLASAFVGVFGGVLHHMADDHVAKSALVGGGVFVSSMTLGILALTFLADRSRP